MSLTETQTSPREVELKLAIASPSARDAAGREVSGARARSVETIYYDTPGRALQSAGYSLRLRRDGERWSQSVKAASGFSRFEQEQRLRGGLPDFSLLDGTPLASIVGVDGAPAPVFVTRVKRRSRKRELSDGRIEVSFDEGEVIARDKSWPILELELELKGGEPRALFDAGRRLAEDNAFVPDFLSKAERGFALADGMLGEPVRFGSYPLDPAVGAVEAFQVLARRCLRQLSLNAELIAGGARLEATHQARTALRRLRVAIGLFEGLLDPPRTEKVKTELRWLTGELGPARNLDVMIGETFQRRAHESADRQAAADFGRALIRAQEAAHARARASLAAPRFRLLLIDLARWIEMGLQPAPIADVAEPGIADFARTSLEHRRRKLVRKIGKLDWDDAHARHKARITAKKMRYAAEFFVGLGPKNEADAYRPFLKSLAKLQDKLGGLNDLAVAEILAPSLVAHEGEGTAFAAGLIVGRDVAGTNRMIRQARRKARAFEETPPWW
ncbi:MAG TPA: CHAD domain-containing protein [Caulobacteraceae bacterium]|jgi:inorganic triphosphatase YgiF